MQTFIQFKLNNETVKISANSVQCYSNCLQIELVKLLVECRGTSEPGKSPLPLLFNKYLRFLDITHIEFFNYTDAQSLSSHENFAEKILTRIAA